LPSDVIYQVVIVHANEVEWANAVEASLRAACVAVLRQDKQLMRLRTVGEAASTDAPALVVVLGSAEAATSATVESEVNRAREEAFAVIPVLRPGDEMRACFPEIVHPLNALPWADDDAPAFHLLRALGIAERERRLFLSYRQAETSQLAVQLRRALSERSYDVFLDRFSVPPGDDFQHRIDIELADKAFVLLLESQGAVGSDWVQHEVTYALAHRIALFALTLPGVSIEHQFEVIDDAFRLQLANPQVIGLELTEETLHQVLAAVEWRYARALRRRRQQLLGSASDFLMRAGYRRDALAPWALLASRGEQKTVVAVTPTVPRPSDLRRADQLRTNVSETYGDERVSDAFLVHDVEDHDQDSRALIDWIVDGRPLSIVALEDLMEAATAAS
jgi:hypothetical protein